MPFVLLKVASHESKERDFAHEKFCLSSLSTPKSLRQLLPSTITVEFQSQGGFAHHRLAPLGGELVYVGPLDGSRLRYAETHQEP